MNAYRKAQLCALGCLAGAVLLALAALDLSYGAPFAGTLAEGLIDAALHVLSWLWWGFLYLTNLWPVVSLICGMVFVDRVRRGPPEAAVFFMWLSMVPAVVNVMFRLHQEYGYEPTPDIAIKAVLLGGFLASFACFITGVLAVKGLDCARGAGWIK